MAKTAMLFGVLMVLIAPISMAAAGTFAKTAMIPAAFGAILLVCGLIATNPNLRKHAMHGAAVVGLLGALGGVGMSVPKLVKGVTLERPIAVYSQLALGILSAVFVLLAVKSFVNARKARQDAFGLK